MTSDQFFIVTHGPVPAVTCTECDKSVELPNKPGAYDKLKDSHECGPRTSPWESKGQS